MVLGVGKEAQLDVFPHGQLFPERASNFRNVANVSHMEYLVMR